MNKMERDPQEDGFRRELILEVAGSLVGDLQWMEMMMELRKAETLVNHRVFDFEENIAFSVISQVDEIIKASKYPSAEAYRDDILKQKQEQLKKQVVEQMNRMFQRQFGGPNNDQDPPQNPGYPYGGWSN